MKLISWNVNGLRACLTHGFAESFAALDADIFSVQETKMQPGQADFAPEGYTEYTYSAEKKGYSGTACWCKTAPLAVTTGIGLEQHDHEGRVLTLEYPGFYLVNCYTPNSQDGLKRLDYRMEWEDAFRAYLLHSDSVDFTFRGADYHVEFAGADVFPQGFAAVAANLRDFTGTNMLCDIGNGTMNVMYINERRPVADKCYTEKFGTHQCMLAVRESVLRQFGNVLDDATIERVLRHGKADIADRYLTAIRETAAEYVSGIFRRLREHEYDPELMKLHVVGGGSCLVKNFGNYEKGCVIFNDDICATTKGYELLAERRMRKAGGIV